MKFLLHQTVRGGKGRNAIKIDAHTHRYFVILLVLYGAFRADAQTPIITAGDPVVAVDGKNISYNSYGFDVDSVGRDSLMQFAEIQFDGRVIPEPNRAVLMALGLLPMLRRRR